MELPEIQSIKEKRRKLGFSQTQLAEKAGVSQSLIARIEAETVDPSYSKAKAIFQALEPKKRKELTAKDLMSEDVTGVKSTDSIEYTAKTMRREKISQIQVFKGGEIRGSITEKKSLDEVSKRRDGKTYSKRSVLEIMEPEFPSITTHASIETVSSLLSENPAAIVKDQGQVKGIITKTDLLSTVTGK